MAYTLDTTVGEILKDAQAVQIMEQYVPEYVVWTVLITIWIGCFLPVILIVAKPLADRVRGA